MRVPIPASRLGGLPVLAMLLVTVGCADRDPSPVATPPPVVEVAHPLERVVTDYQVFTARTQAVENVNIRPRATGYLVKLGFKDGDDIKKDQVLFEIDPRPYQDQLAIAKGNVARLEGQQQYLKAQVNRYTKLAAKGAASQQDVDVYVGQYAENAGALQAAKAQVKFAELNLSWCTVTAPIAGRIDRHFLDVGDLVTADKSLLTNIVSLKPTWAYFDVDQNTGEQYRKLVREGKVKSARTNEIPVQMGLGDSTTFAIAGVVDFVANQLDPNTGSIRLRAVFPNEDGALLAGMFGRVRVPTSAPHPALLVQDSAVGTSQGQKYVLVVNEQNVVDYRPVSVGQAQNGLRQVLPYRELDDSDAKGNAMVQKVPALRVTDRVIVNGLQRVRPGATVNPRLIDMLTLLPVAPKR